MALGIGVVVYAVVSMLLGRVGMLSAATSATFSLGSGFLVAAFIMILKKVGAAGLVSAGTVFLVIAGVLKAISYFLGFSGMDIAATSQSAYLLELGPDDQIVEIESILAEHDIQYERAFPSIALTVDEDLSQVYILTGAQFSFDVALPLLKADEENVDFIEANRIVSLDPIASSKDYSASESSFLANDPLLTQQWAATETHYNDSYRLLSDVTPVRKAIVAILDTGVDAGHEDIADVFGDSQARSDQHGHGTHCAGIAGAVTNNGKGIASLNWNGEFVDVTSYQALSATGSGTLESIAQAIIDAATDGADVISMSLGDYSPVPPKVVKDAVEFALERDVIVLAAAGNSNQDASLHMPSNIEGVISVAAVGPGLKKAPFSNRNGKLKRPIAAPGVNILSLEPGGKYGKKSGTSMATPMVAGLIGVMRAINPEITAETAYETINETGVEGVDALKTGRTIHPARALEHTVATR